MRTAGSGNSSFGSKRARRERIDFDDARANEPRVARSIRDDMRPQTRRVLYAPNDHTSYGYRYLDTTS